MGPPRIVTVWCPDWPVVAAGMAPDVAAAVLSANRVVARTRAAELGGVRIGHRRREAQSRCPELVLLDHDPARDAREFEPVIGAVAELSPRLDVVEPGWLCLAARGPSRYFGGDQTLAERLVDEVDRVVGGPLGVRTGVAVADGRATSAVAARLSAQRGQPVVVAPGGSPAYLSPLPVAWARELGDASAELVDLFVQLGLRTLGDVAALPPADLLARFGPAGLHVHRVASAADDRPPAATEPAPERRVERVFDDPVVQVEPVVFVAKQLADALTATLAGEGRTCTRLVVVAETDHGERSERAWYRATGLSAMAMVERVRWQLDGWVAQPGGLSAGITLLRLVPDEVRGDDGDQLGLWGGRSQADHDAARAISRLTGLAGEQAVRVPAWRGGRLPADRYQWVPAAAVDLEHPEDRLAAGDGPWPGALPAPSPATVLTDPLAVELLDRAGSVVRVGGRGEVATAPVALVVDGTPRPLAAWAGPWPVDQHWWEPQRHRRLARFQVVTADGEAFLVAAEQQRWWVLAVYS